MISLSNVSRSIRLQKPIPESAVEIVTRCGANTWDLAGNSGADFSFRVFQKLNKRRDHVTSDNFVVDGLGDLCPLSVNCGWARFCSQRTFS